MEGYFPAAVWYDYYTGARMAGVSPAGGATITLDAPMDYIPLHIRGGYILPAQQPAMTTAVARTQPFELLVALDDSGVANGFMFWDDGRSLNTLEDGKYLFVQFNATFSLDNGINQGLLTSTPVHTAFAPQAKLGNVVVMGVDWTPSTVTANGASCTFSYAPVTQVLNITGVSAAMDSPLTVQWS